MAIHHTIILGILLHIFGFAYAQINTEALRKLELKEGLYSGAQVDFGYQSGNSEYLTLKTMLRIDYLRRHNNFFLIVKYQRGAQAKQLFLNKGFIHLRGMHSWNKTITQEIFLQKEFDDFTSLSERNLIGGGLRLQLLARTGKADSLRKILLFAGVGGMYEREEVSGRIAEDQRLFRSTNYLSLFTRIDERVRMQLISYFQFAAAKREDYRILVDGSLEFKLTRQLFFQASLNFRYDSQPPVEIKKYDLEISNGIKVWF